MSTHPPGHPPPESAPPASAMPAWGADPVRTIDARPIIAAGRHPIEEVMASLQALGPGQSLALLTPFVPAPLLEKLSASGFEGVSVQGGAGLVRTCLRRRP
jgi:uncharacterized protein (DUF2249 family)